MKNDLRELLADECHNQWSGWMKYLFKKSEFSPRGEAVIPSWAVDRWLRQMNTPYENLPDGEKESDREQADKFLDLIRSTNDLQKEI